MCASGDVNSITDLLVCRLYIEASKVDVPEGPTEAQKESLKKLTKNGFDILKAGSIS
jgi:hypothetical protein